MVVGRPGLPYFGMSKAAPFQGCLPLHRWSQISMPDDRGFPESKSLAAS